MKFRHNSELTKRTFLLIVFIFSLILPITSGFPLNSFNDDFSHNLNTQANGSSEESILWKLGKGLPGTGATMKPRLVNFTENGESLIIVGTNEGLAAITLDGLINMSYRTFGPVIDFDIIEDISGDNIDDIILITYYKDHPNLIAISSNNGTEIWKFKPTIEGISTETFEIQEFITYTWDLEIINDIDEDSISEIVIASWYRIFVVNGKSGSKLWMRDGDFANDVWKLAILEDIDNNGYDTIIAGSEGGKLCAFDSKSGRRIWTFKVDETKLRVWTMMGISTKIIPNSIDDIKVIKDVDNDEIDDILIAADDGYLRLISGNSGLELDNVMIYNITQPTEIFEFSTSPYTSAKRLFTKSGVKIYEIPDIDNDGISEYMSIASDLDYGYSYGVEKMIEGRIFHINPEFEIDRFNITYSLNWTYQEFYSASYPEIIKSDSEVQIYFYLLSTYDLWSTGSAQINWYDLNDIESENPIVVYNDPDQYSSSSQYSATYTANYFLNVGDVNSDGFDDLFAISANGRYLCIDIANDNMLWVKSSKDFELDLTEINDLNSDGVNDLLIKQISNFEPDWIYSESGGEQIDTTGVPTIINELFTIDGKTGTEIWSFKTPSPQYYEGLRDLKNVGDITDDGIDDYVGWIIPSTIPSDIDEIIEALTGEEVIDQDVYGSDSESIYRTLLSKYTKLLAISGSNGTIIWNTPLIDFPYKFYRQYNYNGTYIDPSEEYNTGGNYFNRIDGELDSSWESYGNLSWSNNWDISTLLHPSDIEIINGSDSGNIFDLWGDLGTNYTIKSYNSSDSSKSLKIGTTSESSSIGTVESEDDSYWVLNSITSDGEQRIKAELSFNRSQLIESELQYIKVDYNGFVLDNYIDQIDISIYNFSSEHWKKISTDNINDTNSVIMVSSLNNINGLTSGLDNLVKIKLEAKNSSAFTVSIDELVVNYIYTVKNYTISAEKIGNSWRTLFDLTIPTDLSDDKLLGVMDYQLSQIERFSAFKLQTKLTVNTTNLKWYNFTYEIYDASNDKWVLCNWSDTPTWNNHTYPDLQGGMGGGRIDYKDFTFQNSSQYDYLWLFTRGTHDADPYIEFDYENKTTLSNFIDSNKNMRIRINVTNDNFPFDLIIDNFGIGAFYWGLFSNQYDRFYIWDYAKFTADNLLNLEIQDFDVVNGTNDNYLDVIAIIGIEGVTLIGDPEDEWSTRISLFDIKNKETYTKWSLNKTYIPNQNVRILPINNSLNKWILSGIFQFGNNYNYSHRLIDDPHWESQITHFENYSKSKVALDFIWEEIPQIPKEEYSSIVPYEFPGITYISKNGKIGVILGLYEQLESEYYLGPTLTYIRVIDVNSRDIISKISTLGLETFGGVEVDRVGKVDFSLEGAGYRLLISNEDFNDDGFLDHVGFYYPEMIDGPYFSGIELRIYSGNSGDLDPVILYRNIFEDVQFSHESINKFTTPFTSIDDINNDGFPDVIVGIQTRANSYRYEGGVISYSFSDSKGSYINYYDIHNSNENELNELTEYKWVLDPFKSLNRYYTPNYEFIFDAERIGDINADNSSEVYISRYYYSETVDEYGWRYYLTIPTTEILDLINQNIIYRFNMDVDSIYPTIDLNDDGNNELLIASEEIIYCINSKFGIQILTPKSRQSMGSHGFDVKWSTDSVYDYFEVIIDGVSQGPTTAKKIHVSLGSGWRQISVIMHDTSGLIITASTINVLVPPNEIHLILTFIFLGAVAGLYVVYRRYSKKKEELVLIDRKIKEGGTNK
ncbi:hypothetical protein LCGC14_0985910 [marine sediment metagenome]|uniref:Pyrrolo-quinoline quinone repeat domain-containing protein n=1 Tax=marine sediment metagenome TaxID=412755 RepID=A0A0F9QQL4_9ZZZZ